jgi:hypothetical protein
MSETVRVNLAKLSGAIVAIGFFWGIAWTTAAAHERLNTVERENIALKAENQEVRRELTQIRASLNRIETNLDWLMKQKQDQ